MSKPEWGTKRTCHSCSAKYYDFRKNPAVCPKCGTEFDPLGGKGRRGRKAKVEAEAVEEVVVQEEELVADVDLPDEEELAHIDESDDDDGDDEDLQVVAKSGSRDED